MNQGECYKNYKTSSAKKKRKEKKRKNRTNVCKVSITKYNEERLLEISKFQNHLFNLRNR